MKMAILGFLILASLAVHAQEADCETPTEKRLKPMIAVAKMAAKMNDCPKRDKFEHMCMMIGDRTPNEDPDTEKQIKYMYQKTLLDAGCVDIEKDSEEVQAEKIQKAWNMYQADLECNSSTFDVRNGHILKYAIADKFDEFIDDVIKYRLNLNKIDSSDGRTTLDYIQYHINRTKGTALESKYQSYYKRLKKAGAKHKSEL
jgi:hypothetical protein